VVLIPAIGPPTSKPRWALEGATTSVRDAAGEPFTINTQTFCLLELLPYVPGDRPFRLRAEVRQNADKGDAGTGGLVGIYHAYSEEPSDLGFNVHCFVGLSFTDTRALPAGNRVQMELYRYWITEPQPGPLHHFGCGVSAPFKSIAEKGDQEPWRKLRLEVTATETRAFWNDKLIRQKVSHEKLREHHSPALLEQDPRFPKVQPGYNPRAGLGLFVLQGSASFRSVVIEPIPEAP
jgi:hypothetical protein